MIDRIRDLILEAAGKKADGAGVPVDRVHIHAAAAEVGALVMQAREALMGAVGALDRVIPIAYGGQRVEPNLISHQSFQGAPPAAAQDEPPAPIDPEPAAASDPAASAGLPAPDPVPEAQPE